MTRYRIRYTIAFEFDVSAPTVADAVLKAKEILAATPKHKTVIGAWPADGPDPTTSHATWYMAGLRKRGKRGA